ncbi:MAG TPA: efflux RND transporter periplasmic adaptor subunit [Candidatus Limnocylindrales bacterium]|jgi:membrane fusion protein (multidrug efflux system)|nr:efflux RND transporter periplasmic adaptor subunit [Candidatus Limnocylindrales bacterium]
MSAQQRCSSIFATVVLLTLATLALSGCSGVNASAPPPKPPEVQVTQVVQKDVPIVNEWTATLDGFVNAQIQPHVSGYLIRQDYKEGSYVRKGQVLFEIDPRPFSAALNQAKGQLAQAEAGLVKTEQDVKRDTPLAQARAIAQSQLDTEIQSQLGAKAAVETAKAAVEQAELNLEFTKVTSLVDGIAGIAQTQIGNLVSPTTVLTSVSQVNPIKAYFSISEQQYLASQRADKNGSTDPWKGVKLKLMLADGTEFPHPGSFLLADRQVDPNTGTIRVAGSFPNPNNLLRPGQFGRVIAETGTQRSALLVPMRAVTELQGNYQLAVVGSDNKVNIRPVKVGPTVGKMFVIEDGLKPQDRVIVEGLQKVKDGTVVTPKAANL